MNLLVALKTNPEIQEHIRKKLGKEVDISFLPSAPDEERKRLLEDAETILAMNFRQDVKANELAYLKKTKLIQITLAGSDAIPFDRLEPGITICSNGGAFSEPIAEHAIGMMLALARNFMPLHRKLSKGEFDQKTKHKMLSGATLGIVGFGGIGKKTAELARGFGMRIIALNSSGSTTEKVDFIGTLADLDRLLENSDFILISVALNKKTKSMIGARELGIMRPDAVLVNVARGDLIDERSLYEHLKSHPLFKAGLEAWWIEPFNHPKFEVHYPFFELDNVLGSPHNSYLTEGIHLKALDQALGNIMRFIRGEKPRSIQKREDYV